MKSVKPKPNYQKLLSAIGNTIEVARTNAVNTFNAELVKANWEIGRHIVEFEQQGKQRAEYGSDLLARLSKDLKLRYGKGFGRRNILDMRRFYLAYQKLQAVPAKLSWTHIVTLIAVNDDITRKFYEKQTLIENWGYRELERQINSSLFERLALSKDKKGVLQLAEKGNIVSQPHELMKDPYVLDFLKIPQSNRVTEKALEQKLNEPIGIILSAEKDEVMVEYAMGGISNKIFVSKYQLYLPDKKLLQQKIKALMYDK